MQQLSVELKNVPRNATQVRCTTSNALNRAEVNLRLPVSELKAGTVGVHICTPLG